MQTKKPSRLRDGFNSIGLSRTYRNMFSIILMNSNQKTIQYNIRFLHRFRLLNQCPNALDLERI